MLGHHFDRCDPLSAELPDKLPGQGDLEEFWAVDNRFNGKAVVNSVDKIADAFTVKQGMRVSELSACLVFQELSKGGVNTRMRMGGIICTVHPPFRVPRGRSGSGLLFYEAYSDLLWRCVIDHHAGQPWADCMMQG